MPRQVSLNFRAAASAQQTDEVPVMLWTVTHPNLDAPLHFSSDPTVRISAEPLVFGTRHLGTVYPFILLGALLPDDQDKSPPRTTLVLENVSSDMVKAARSILSPATADLSVVLAGTPDMIEARFTGLRIISASYDANEVSFEVSREPFTSEPMPAGRMTASYFPGLHR